MKVCMLNGSANQKGNTYLALSRIAKVLKDEGVDSEIIYLGNGSVRDCIGCNCCSEVGKCVFDDDSINEIADKIIESDGLIVGSPVYFAHASGRLMSVLDRLFYSRWGAYARKPAVALAVARRAGTSATLDVINKHLTIAQMMVISSTYWNVAFGNKKGEVLKDEEGMQTLDNLAKNMAWALKCIEAGKSIGVASPNIHKTVSTNFIR